MKHKRIVYSAALLVIACFASESAGQTTDKRASATQIAPSANAPFPAAKQKVAEEYGKLPLSFEANHGQTDPKVSFLSRGPGYKLFLLPHEAVLMLQRERHARTAKKLGAGRSFPEASEREASPAEIIRMSLLGASPDAEVTGIEEMPGRSNYFVGNDPSQWRTNVPNYAKVHYQGVYPGIDLVYHGSHQQLEYDFIVAPGADPRQIRLGLKGAKKLELTPEGDLLLSTSGEPVRLRKPVIYQEFGGKRKPIDGSFVLAAKDTVKFRVGEYDASQPLIIDPVLAYSTLVGGNGFDEALGIAVDSLGSAYITGLTDSTSFATAGAFQTTLNTCGNPPSTFPCEEAFVAKLNPAGNGLVYVTYLGGTGFSQGSGIAVFSGGNAYVTGTTTASNFPTTNGAFQTVLKGAENAFVTQLNATGSGLVFSTYLGGSGTEFPGFFNGGNPIAVDTAGNAYVAGTTTSGDFPTTAGAFQTASGGGVFRSLDSAATWSPGNSGLTSPNISVLAVDPKTPTNVYAGTSDAGVFKSTNSGQAWSASNNGLGTLNISTLVLDPATPTTLYAGTAIGVFKSTNSGATWAAANTGLVFTGTNVIADVQALSINPLTPATLYAGGFEGAFKTIDGGANWTSLNAGFSLPNSPFPLTPDITSIVVDPVTTATVYAGTQSQGVFKSVDGGSNWAAVNTGLTFPNSTSFLNIRALAIDAKAPNNLYAITLNSVGVYKTADGGSNWSAVNTGLADLNTAGIVADPTVSKTLYVGTGSSGVFKTTNGGASWATSTNALSNFIVNALAIDRTTPANLYAGSSVEHAFVAKFGSSGAIGYSTYLGGSSLEFGGSIAVDSLGQAYITGGTESRNFPTTPGAFRTARQSTFDAFVTELNPAGSAPVFSTYLGGSAGFAEGFGIAVDTAGSAYVTGIAGGSNFPTTAGALQTVNGGDNAFITKFSPAGNTLVYSTFLGGSGGNGGFAFDEPQSIAVDASGNAWVAGITEDLNFPTVNPIRSSSPCQSISLSSCFFSLFVSEVSPTGSALLFSTYFGPTEFFNGGGIALDPQGNAYVAGTTNSTDFPTVNPLPGTATLVGVHGFVSKIANTAVSTDLAITLGHSPDPVPIGQNITFTSTIRNNGPNAATGVTFYPTQVPNSTVNLFKTLATETPSQGTCDANEFCFLGTLAPGASATVTLAVTTSTGQEGTQTVAVGVGGNESDPIPANNVASTIVNVLGAVDLRLAGTASPAPVILGGNLTYLLVVNNKTGPSPATGVTLTDTLPAGVTFVSATPTQGTCTGTTTVVCSLGTVAVAGTASVNIVVKTTTVGAITNNSIVTANEVNNSAGRNVLRQVSDVIAVSNANNARLKGSYAFLFQGSTPDALMAFAGSFVADGNGNLTNGISDTNTSSISIGVVSNPFTGTYNVGADNRGTMTMTTTGTGATTLTFRFALGSFNSQGVATKARFIEFDASARHGAGVIEMQDPTAFSAAAIKGNFVFGVSGEDANASHFAAAGRVTADGLGNFTNGLEDTDMAGVLSPSLGFTGTYSAIAANGRGTYSLAFPPAGSPALNYALYVVSANEVFSISTDLRTLNIVLSSGQALKQQTAAFSNAWLNGNSVFNMSGALPTTGTDVQIGLLTTDGVGNITVVSDRNNAGVITLNQTGNVSTYSVAASGRTTFVGTGANQPILYLVDLNKGFFVSTDANAGTGSLDPQVGGLFTNASLSGSYFFGDFTPNALIGDTGAGVASADGAGNLIGTQDQDHPPTLIADAAFIATDVVSLSGRTTLSFGGGDSTILYLISPTKAVAISTNSGNANDRVTVVEGSVLPAAADLAITKSASVTQAVIGQQFFYNLSVKNNGPGLATGVVVTDSLPPTVTLALASASQGVCSGPAPVVCSLGAIHNGSIVDISIVVTAAAAGAAQNSATVSANEADTNLANNTASSAAVTVLSTTDLTLITTATPDSVILGSNLTFSVTAVNVGNQAASNVIITDTLSAGVTFVSATPPPGAVCTTALPTVTCPVGGLASGASFTVTIVVTPTVVGTITNTATVTPTDPTPGDNTASADATVLPVSGTIEGFILTDVNAPNVLEFNTAGTSPIGSAHAGTAPDGAAISPNGRIAFVGNLNSNYISVIDLTINAEIARIRGVRALRSLALNADGTRLVVPSANGDEVDIIDTSNFAILKRVSLNGVVGDDPNNPNDIILGSVVVAGNSAYINTISTTAVPLRTAVVDLTTFAASSIPGSAVGFGRPRSHIAATPDGKKIVIPRFSPPTLLIIDTATNQVSQTVSLPSQPSAIAITRNAGDPNGIFGYVSRAANAGNPGNKVSTLDFNPGSATFGTLLAGKEITLTDNINGGDIGITDDGNRLIVTAFQLGVAHNVIVLDTQVLRGATPANAIVNQFLAGGGAAQIESVQAGLLQQQPPTGAPAPSIVNVTPGTIVNDVPNTIHIHGNNFAAGALVRVGTLDPIPASNVTATDLDVLIPQAAPSQVAADILVTNPNVSPAVINRQVSGILHGGLQIQTPATFQPVNEVAVTAFGDNAIAILNDFTKFTAATSVSSAPLGMAISADGLRAYVLSFRANGVDVVNLNTKLKETTITLATDTFRTGQTDAIVTATNPATGNPAEYLLTGSQDPVTGNTDLRVVVIDSAPTSPTFNTIIASFQGGQTNAFPGALAVTPDGRTGYANDGNTGNLVVFDLLKGTATAIPAATIGDAVFQAHIEVTPDKKSLLLVTTPGSLLIFDIGANPSNPVLVTTITGTPPTGFNALNFGNFRVVGNRLFAYDASQNVVQAFNFDRAASNFSQLASFVVPGNVGIFANGLSVTPDGALLYLTLEEDDAIAAIDNVKFLAGNPSPLITKVQTGLTPTAIVISPGKALVASLAITKTAVPTIVIQGTTVTYTMAVTNGGPSSSTGVTVTDVLPAGLTFVSATPSQGTCTGPTTVTCSLGTLANGATASVSLTATATAAGTITNTASVTENETNPTPANASASATITVTNTTVCAGATILWTGTAGDGQWMTPGNWNTGTLPKASDQVCIDTPFAGTRVTLANSQQTVGSLIAASSFVLSNTSAATSLAVISRSVFLNALTLNGATLSSSAGVALELDGPLSSSGTSSIVGGAGFIANAGFTISGTLTVSASSLTNLGPGTLSSGSTIQLGINAALDNRSSLAISNGSILTSSGSSVINRAGATINVSGSSSTITVPVTNLGTVNVNGILSLSGGYTQTSGVTALNTGGSLSTSTALNINGGLLAGTGVISGGVSVASGGIMSPGFSPGTIAINGAYAQANTGSYNVEIGGLTAGTQYDQITGPANGTASLNGTLNASLINGFVPVAGNSFAILSCGASACVTGTFSTVNVPALPNGLGWTITYGPTSVILTVSAAASADLSIMKTATVTSTHLGGPAFTYTITVTNNGPSAATGITVTDPLPSTVAFSSVTPSQGTCTPGATITCSLGSLVSGAKATVSILVTPAAVGSIANTVTVAANEPDPLPANNSASVTVPVLATADLALQKTAQPNPVNVGSNLTYTLTITNNGPSSATGVTLIDALPAGLTFVSSNTSQGTCSGTATVTCTIGTFASAATATVTIVVKPTAATAITNTATVTLNEFDPNTANNTASVTVTPTSSADLALTKTALPSPAGIGSNLTYTLIVTNNGPSPATNVTLTDTLPAGPTFVSAVSTQGTCSGTATCTIGTLANAAQATVTIVVKPVAAGNITNTASVTATETDPNSANNTASVTTTVTASADLAVTKIASLSTTHLGAGPFTYTVTITNNGPSPATGVTLNDALPTAVQLFAAPTPSQGTCNANTPISCALGTLANGASATVSIQVQPVAVGSPVNTATATANEADPVPANNSASVAVQILPSADMALTKTAQPNPVNAGSPLTYTLTVTNNGPSPATGVKITDTLPAGATFASASPACTGTSTVTCNFATLAVNTSAIATITVTPTGSGTLTNTASASANEFDPIAANNTSTASVSVTPIADLAITKTASPSPAGVGGTLTYTLTVTNNGPSPATTVTLTDTLPAGPTFVSAASTQGTCSGTTTVTCAIGTLANAAKATITIVVKPTAAGTVTNTASVAANETDPVPGNNAATVSTPVTASADVALTETVAPNPVLLGGSNLTYTITITNNGPSPATNVTITDTLPAGVTFVGTTPSQGTCTNPLSSCAIGNLASGASATVIVVVKPNATGAFSNSATVAATEADPNTANNSASASATVNPAADLSLAETATPQTVTAGNNVTFSFTVTNSGPSTATGVTIADALPVGMVLVSATPSQGTCTTAISCNLGTIANGATATLSIVAQATAPGNFNNTASVSANEADPFPSNNTAIASIAVVASADIAIAVSASPNPAGVGGSLTFTMTVTNNGPSPATGVLVVGGFTTGATIVSITPSQGAPCTGTAQFNCNLGALASGARAVVIAVVTPTAPGTFSITDSVAANEPDPVTTNNSTTVSVNVVTAPVVTLSAASLNFASQPVGTPSTIQGVTLTNTSSALPLTNLGIVASGDFAQTNNCGTSLAALSSCSILVTFTPTATGTRIGAITISDNAVGSPQNVSLTGIGINAPAITLSPGSLIFSSRLVGTSSPPLAISMSNSGNATLNIASIAITGTNAGDFSQTSTCGQTLAPSTSCTISVVFKPTAGGQRTAGVAITSDARGSVPVVTLSGTGLSAGLDLSSSLLIFDNQTVGTTSASQTVTLSNGGATAVAITSITASGDFAQTNNCNNSVTASSNCAIRVTFTPTATGTRTGSVSIVSGDSTTPLTVNLTGTGVVVTLSLSPASLTFNDQKVGTSSQAQSIALTNTGGAALTINSIVPSGDFLEADNCGSGLAAGAGCSINVTFLPTTTGTRNGSITVTSNAQSSPHTVKLTGNGISRGPAVSLTCTSGGAAAASLCTSLTFPAQAVNTTSGVQQVTLTNAGNDTLNITGIAASGDFADSSSCAATLAASASCSISVTFTPTATGTRAGFLVIKDNAGDSPQSINLTGTGTPSGPAVNLSATALPFGSQLVGTTSNVQLVTVTNPGNAALTFTSIKASGDFADTDTCANGVPANSSCTISVTFTPTATGARAGAITISDNAPGSPQAVTLSGGGTDVTISVPPGGSTSATVSAGQPATFLLSLAPSGGFSGLVTVSCNSAIPAGTCSSSPSSFTLDAPVTVTTTVTTMAPSHSTVLPVPRLYPRNFAPLRAMTQILLLLVAFLVFFVAALRRRRAWIAVTAGLFLVAFVAGCAGGSGNPGVVGPTVGTPPNAYTVTVVVKTASGATRSMPLTVIVH
jgi:uncharacterized repeat protein (TIGR01451 family)